MFNQGLILQSMENLQSHVSGAFTASPAKDYHAVWLRDFLFMIYAYYYLDIFDKLTKGMHTVFDIFRKHRHKLEKVLFPEDPRTGFFIPHEMIHTKYNPDTLNEFTNDWGHHQNDTIGLFLHMVADLNFKNIEVRRDKMDEEILQLLVFYLNNVRYWEKPDFGMWEECCIKHSSSIGAAYAGLSYIKRRGLAEMPNELIDKGRDELHRILPYESRDYCNNLRHLLEKSHDCDSAQLFLIWPFNVLEKEWADIILSRILDGHKTENEIFHQLKHPLGIIRYWGDEYRRSYNGISAQWQWDFLVSIIYSQRHDYDSAIYWFKRGESRIIDRRFITEAFTNDQPDDHTPLGWHHALALIAWCKLPTEIKKDL